MTWTRERPKGVDAMRDYQNKRYPTGARSREYYPADDPIQSRDGRNDYTDSWWHPVRADGRYPALPVEDGRKWVPTKGHTLTGRGWNAWKSQAGEWVVKPWDHIEVIANDTPIPDGDYVLPYVDGDTRDTLPPLPSDETPAPMTPAEEVTLRGYAVPMESMSTFRATIAPPAAEPSRLEIADWQLRAIVAAPWMMQYSIYTDLESMAKDSLLRADALIAAARKGGAS